MRLNLVGRYAVLTNSMLLASFAHAESEYVSSAYQLEEVVVTAQKRVENLQSVPIAVTSLSSDFLDEHEIRSIQDLAATVPGLVTTRSVGYGAAPLSIRGIGGANGGGNVFADEPVATYLNGVYIGPPAFNVTELLDIESIQVLRGPQGTLYGRNATAGALLIETRKPGEEFEGEFRASVTDLDEISVSGAFGGPLTERLGARLAAGDTQRDGYGENTVTGRDFGGSDSQSIRGTLTFNASDSLDLVFAGEHSERDATPMLQAVTGIEAGGGVGSPYVRRADLNEVLESDEFSIDGTNEFSSTNAYYSLSVQWSISEQVTFDAVTGYFNADTNGSMDSDSSSLTLFSNNAETERELLSQEFRLSGEREAFDWIVGLYYMHENAGIDIAIQNQNSGGVGFSEFPPTSAPVAHGLDVQFDADNETEAYALFFDASFHLSERLKLTLGGRWSEEKKSFTNTTQGLFLRGSEFYLAPTGGGDAGYGKNPGDAVAPGDYFRLPVSVAHKERFEDVSPRVVIDYVLGDDAMIYTSYSQGFKSGGFNSFGLDESFDPENVDAYEVGLKSTLFDQRLRLNLSAYRYDYEGLQLRLPVVTGGVEIENIGAAEISGFEAEMSAILAGNLTVSASYTYLDASMTEGTLTAIPTDVTPFLFGSPFVSLTEEDVAGNDLTRAPRHAFNINARYEWQIGSLLGTFIATYRWQDSVYFLETNQDADTFWQDAWSELDVRLGISTEDRKWELALFGQNVLDERYMTQIAALGGFPNASVSEPRKWGLQLIARF
ncbi:TonB-dependent receptor [Parahaliea mediterranea]|uniref:TonB-dependent receptor n=1 Tax=Parahaliea mediterranea TaxID=651086 RepID=A0A939DDN4_9GAMM|nr:TonB-dependent receptor [Parahaliea mediterranea]MBN7796174.1 TonB-dependent receptor [Parahaliea mediterranea]